MKPPNKHWIPWLTEHQRKTVLDGLQKVVGHELQARHWGTSAPGKSPGGSSRFYVTDLRGLHLASGIMRYYLNDCDTDLYYRGQLKDYPLRPSLYREVGTKSERDRKESWLVRVMREIEDKFVPIGSTDDREALAQHYGLSTRWLDVVDHVQCAAWFAYHRTNPPSDPNTYDGCSHDDDVGYIYLLAIPRNGVFARVVDLRLKPSTWLRPHVQQAFSVRAEDPGRHNGELNCLNVLTFVVPRHLLKLWSGYEVVAPELMFPNYHQDAGLL